MDEILFENLKYGTVQLQDHLLLEDARYVGTPVNKLQYRKIRLPDGKGNIVYLLSDTFENCVKMIENKYFSFPVSYKRIFYPFYLNGIFMKRRFRYKVTDKKNRDVVINTKTKLRPYPNRLISNNSQDNLFFTCNDLYENTKKIANILSIKRLYSEYIPDFCKILKDNTPSADTDGKANSGNRILIIDSQQFGFTTSSKLNDLKCNFLYLLYLAFLRNRDLKNLNVDMDMLICSDNLFMKFNPSKLSSLDWNNFRKGLFVICKQNLDDLTDSFSNEEKKELEETSKDLIVSNIVKERIKPFVKNVSGSTKAILQDVVEKKLRTKIANVVKKDEEIKKTKDNVNKQIGVNSDKDKEHVPVKRKGSLIHRNVVKDPLSDRASSFFKSIAGDYLRLATPTGMSVISNDDKEKDITKKPSFTMAANKIDALNNPNMPKVSKYGMWDNDEENDFDTDYDDMDDNDQDEDNLADEQQYKDEFGEAEADIANDVQEILQDEDTISEVLDEIQDDTIPINNRNIVAPINSERDKKLREEQKKVVVRSETIEQILERDTNNVKIEEKDLSKSLHTTNQNLYKMKFANFEKTYLDNLFLKDLVSVFDALKDAESPFYITNIDIKDTSNTMDYKDTWTVSLKDETGTKHTIKVDIPKFIDNKFMRIQGTKYMILKQNFYNPLVKDTPDVVILTTNFNKITISRKSTKSFSTIERLFSLVKKTDENDKIFTVGNSSKTNLKYLSSLEYDELSRKIFSYNSDKCQLYFSRDYIEQNILPNEKVQPKGNEFFIGFENNDPIYINEDTGLDRSNRTIADIMEEHLPDKYKAMYNKIKGPSISMHAICKAAGQEIPVGVCLMVWDGLTQTLQNMKIQWRFIPNVKSLPSPNSAKKYIRFSNGILEYEAKLYAELIMNGLQILHPEQFTFEQANLEEFYDEYIYSQWGSYNGITELKNFKEFLIDPITKSVCKDLMLPDTASGLLIHGVKLLCDNASVSKASDKSYRVRSIEIIPAILYNCINAQYKQYIKSGRKLPMTLRQNCVLQTLITDVPTVEAYSTLSPAIEVHKSYVISAKGFKGSNSDDSYDEEKRSYDPSSIGKLTTVTSAKKIPIIGRVKPC